MNLRSMRKPIALALILMCSGPVVRGAGDEAPPDWFVSPDQCPSRPCECKDLPMMKKFRDNQVTARDAWKSVDRDLRSGTGPTTQQGAKDLFRTYFGSGDPDVTAQFKNAPCYVEGKNNVNRVAGVGRSGKPLLDPCFCASFCQDIVDATVAHERTHVPTVIISFLGSLPVMVRCALEIVPSRICGVVEPMQLTTTEIFSHQAGILSLDSSITDLQNNNPAKPGTPCPTTTPIVESATPRPPVPSPHSFTERVAILFDRIVRGAR